MSILPTCTLVLGMLLPAQAPPVQPVPGLPGLPGLQPGQSQPQPTNPMRPGQPMWWLTTQFPIWLVIIIGARRQQQAQAARQKMLAEEEENQTPYTEEDLMQDFEFKIVRNELNFFDCPRHFDEVLREEGQAGWQLVEKFDGNRMRLKRPASQRENDSALPPDFDPYRTAVLLEETNSAKAAKRLRDMKVIGWVLAGTVLSAVLFGMIAATIDRGVSTVFAIAAISAGIFAAIAVIGLIARYFSK